MPPWRVSRGVGMTTPSLGGQQRNLHTVKCGTGLVGDHVQKPVFRSWFGHLLMIRPPARVYFQIESTGNTLEGLLLFSTLYPISSSDPRRLFLICPLQCGSEAHFT